MQPELEGEKRGTGRMADTVQDTSIDAVTLSVVYNKLLAVTREVGDRVVRSAQSFVMSNARDLGAVLLDDRGHVATTAEFAILHCFVAEIPTRAILDRFEGKLHPGDCVLANDGHIVRSGHLPDSEFLFPVFG